MYLFGKSGIALYHLVLACTNRGILVLAGTGRVQTGTYQYRPVRSNLPVYVQGYRVPDAGWHLERWVTMISHVISHNCDITCDIELHHVI